MKLPRLLALAALALAAVCPALLSAADAAKSIAGYWAGAISTPRGELAISVEWVAAGDGKWKGTIDSPKQGVRAFAFETTKISGIAVDFTLQGLPGEPAFNGQLSADGKSIAGEAIANGGGTPFRLERTAKPAPQIDPHAVPAKGEPGKGLAGKWRGSIKPIPGIELRLDVDVTVDADGKLSGNMISLDQGSPPLPLGPLTEKAGSVSFEVAPVRGSFTGKFNADSSEISGEWTQGGRPTPMVLKRRAAK